MPLSIDEQVNIAFQNEGFITQKCIKEWTTGVSMFQKTDLPPRTYADLNEEQKKRLRTINLEIAKQERKRDKIIKKLADLDKLVCDIFME